MSNASKMLKREMYRENETDEDHGKPVLRFYWRPQNWNQPSEKCVRHHPGKPPVNLEDSDLLDAVSRYLLPLPPAHLRSLKLSAVQSPAKDWHRHHGRGSGCVAERVDGPRTPRPSFYSVTPIRRRATVSQLAACATWTLAASCGIWHDGS